MCESGILSVEAILRYYLRDDTVLRSTESVTLEEDLSSLISTHVGQLTVACKSSSIAIQCFLGCLVLICTPPPHTYIHIKIKTSSQKRVEVVLTHL